MTSLVPRRAVGAALLAFPLLIQIPYSILIARFDYPNILRQPAEIILTRFAQQGPEFPLVWYAYGACIVPLLVAIAALPGVLSTSRLALLTAATRIGIVSATLQLVGLLRWAFLVPILATAYTVSGHPLDTVVLVFTVQHQLLGCLMGEHIGQILLALWTSGVALSVTSRRWQLAVGLVASGLFLIGSFDGFASTILHLQLPWLQALPGIAFALWSLWCLMLGWIVFRSTD